MKLLIVTVVDEYQKEVFKIFKQAEINIFSKLDIEGFKTSKSLQMSSNWFGSERSGTDSEMFFSFSDEEKIEIVFKIIKDYNQELKTNNPIRAIVVPIEKYI